MGDFLCLFGDLGVGKFIFVCVLIWSLVGNFDFEVLSLIFMLVQVYELDWFDMVYFDFYWIEEFEELIDFVLDDFLEIGVVLVEWLEMVGDFLLVDVLWF